MKHREHSGGPDLRVHSADGTRIAYEQVGQGPALILIGGAFCDRRAKASGTPLAARLAHRFTVYSYDRRGRGDSDQGTAYALTREVEDLAALVAAAGGSASLFGMSSGGWLALEAARAGVPVEQLALYEAPLHPDPERRSERLAAELEQLAAKSERSQAAALFLTQVVQVPQHVVAGMQKAPMWSGLTALAHTLSYDVRLTAHAHTLLGELGAIRARTTVLCGEASPVWMREGAQQLAQALPNASCEVLQAQTHDVDPAVLAEALERHLAR